MDQLNNPYFSKHFTSEMKNNRLFNFSRYIDEDMKTFLISIAGNNAEQLPMKMFCDLIFRNYFVNTVLVGIERRRSICFEQFQAAHNGHFCSFSVLKYSNFE